MAKAPLPGRAVRGSSSGRPIMALLDLLGRRWTLRILWEMRDLKPRTFRELQALVDAVSPSVLNTRLAELRRARLVASGSAGYALTPLALELIAAFEPIDAFAKRWSRQLARSRSASGGGAD